MNLIERNCLCGCGKKFRVMPGSPSYYWSQLHNPQYAPKFNASRQPEKNPVRIPADSLIGVEFLHPVCGADEVFSGGFRSRGRPREDF
jgi:hypothetical protein